MARHVVDTYRAAAVGFPEKLLGAASFTKDLTATKKCTVGMHGSCKPQDNCPCCIQGAAASKKKERIKALRPSANVSLGQVSVDTHGPYPIKSPGGHAYVLVFVDGFSRYTFCRLMRSKTESTDALKEFCQEVGCPSSVLTDWGTEFEGPFRKYCIDKGIQMRKSCPYVSWMTLGLTWTRLDIFGFT